MTDLSNKSPRWMTPYLLNFNISLDSTLDEMISWTWRGRRVLKKKGWTQKKKLLKLSKGQRKRWTNLCPRLHLLNTIHLLLSLLLKQQVSWKMSPRGLHLKSNNKSLHLLLNA